MLQVSRSRRGWSGESGCGGIRRLVVDRTAKLNSKPAERTPRAMTSLKTLENLGRIRLSPNFFMRDFLHSEVAQIEGIANVPVDADLAVEAGRNLCLRVLEPIQAALGKVSIRSAYRSPTVNQIGNKKGYNCASNEFNRTRHIWDLRDEADNFGATACIVVNAFVDYFEETGDWPALAWWVHDHVPAYREMTFYPNLAAFNINWYSGEVAEQTISAHMPNPATGQKGMLTRTGWDNFAGMHADAYHAWLETLR